MEEVRKINVDGEIQEVDVNEEVDKQDLLEQLGETVEFSKQFAEKKVQYFKLEMAEQSAKVMSGIITATVVLSLGSLALVFGLIVLALWIGSLAGSLIAGFGSVALLLLSTMLVLFIFRKTILMNPIVDMIVSKMFE